MWAWDSASAPSRPSQECCACSSIRTSAMKAWNNFHNAGKASTNDFDVHGNQYRLMSESKCFLASNKMTCSTCHDPHKNATTDLAFYSQKCMGCHSEANHNFCTMAASLGASIKNNCIDCHMPKKPSEAISFKLAGSTQTSSYLLRTHRIGRY